MKQFNQLKEAHKTICELMEEIETMLVNIEANASQIAKVISRLAGILKIHLGNEDLYLYPAMLKSEDITLQSKATAFQSEMGGLSEAFMSFKDMYNTQSKITQNLSTAEKDINLVFKKIKARIHEEDNDLYPLAEKVM